MRKRLLSALLALCMVLALLPTAFAANSTAYSDSGSTSMAKLTKLEIARLMELTRLSDPTQIYSTAPGLSAPYSAGSLRQDVIQAGLDRLNVLRRIAGLPAVSLDTSYNELAQAASLVNAVNNDVVPSHTLARPSGMGDALYQQGCAGAGSGNLANYFGYQPVDGPIALSVDWWMDDSDAYNVVDLGHRRWQLNPAMGKTGFGAVYAADTDNTLYSAGYAHDFSGSGTDYTFIAWPASGNFPAVDRLFHADTAWSVTLNPGEYRTPSKSDLTVTLTRESDGYSWTFRGSESYTAAGSGKYFNLDTSYYGVNNCIIFRPDGVEQYDGVYTVTITGLRASSGEAAALSYQVDFFDPNDPAILDPAPVDPGITDTETTAPGTTDPETTDPGTTDPGTTDPGTTDPGTTDPGTTDPGTTDPEPTGPEATGPEITGPEATGPEITEPEPLPFTDVPEGQYYSAAVAWAVRRGITTGKTDTSFDPEDGCTRAQIVTFLWRAYGRQKPTSTVNPFTDVNPGDYFYEAVLWAVENGITTGASATTFNPGGPCTRAQAVTFQYRAAGSPAVTGGNSFTDVDRGSYYAPAVAWAVANNITTGKTGTSFDPEGGCTRAQIVTFLYREMGQ